MSVNAIGAIGRGDDKAGRTEQAAEMKRKNPWEDIGNALNGFGAYLSNINPGNSVFTAGNDVQGAFGD